MIGWQNAVSSIGSAACSFILSYLLTFGWHTAFSIYALAFPIMVLFGSCVSLTKASPRSQTKKTAKPSTGHAHLNLSMVGIASLILLFFIALVPMSYKLPQLIVNEKIGSASDASVLYGIFIFIGIPLSIIYGYLRKHLGELLFPLSLLCTLIGFIMVATSTQLWLMYVAVIIAGAGFATAVPFFYDWLARVTDAASVNLATTIGVIFVNTGVFLSPLIMNALASNLASGAPKDVMFISIVIFSILLVIASIHYGFLTKRNAKLAHKNNSLAE